MNAPARPRRRLGVGVIVALAVAIAAALGVGTFWSSRAPQGAAAPTAAAASAPPPAVELAAGDVATATQAELVRTLEVSGGLKAVASAIVKARVAAEVRALAVREGDAVRAGQLLGRLDDTEFTWRLRQAQDQAASARSQLEIAERTLANNRALVDQGFISKNALETSAMSASAAQSTLQAALAAVELQRKSLRDAEIRAPIGGLVAQRFVQPGERVAVDARLLEIVDLARIELEAAVAPEDVLGLRVGQRARVTIDGAAEPVAARVVRINPSTQAGTRAVLAYLALDATAGLRQGLFARGSVELARASALVVPASALRADQARPYLVVLGADGRALHRPVRTGARGEAALDGGAAEPVVEILEGLQAGERVLRGTVGTLREGTRLRLPGGGAAVAATR